MLLAMSEVWRKCSSCKKEIRTGERYYVCSVSTCSGKATNYVFCSVDCWEAHVPVERHREGSAGALERKAPASADAPAEEKPRRILVSEPGAAPKAAASASEDEVLVVVTKVRKYIADRSGMNTSASLYDALSDKIRRLCDMAIETARSQGRKTVMDRDLP